MKKMTLKKQKVTKKYATFVEYALLVGLLAIGIAVAIALFGQSATDYFDGRSEDLDEIGSDVEEQREAIEMPQSER